MKWDPERFLIKKKVNSQWRKIKFGGDQLRANKKMNENKKLYKIHLNFCALNELPMYLFSCTMNLLKTY